MLRTVAVSSCISVQGLFVRALSDGKIVVQVDDKTYVGLPVEPMRRAS